MLVIIFWLLCGFFASLVAQGKGHSSCMWFLGGCLLGPLAFLATLGLGDKNQKQQQAELLDEIKKQNRWQRRQWEAEQDRLYEEEIYRRQQLERRLLPAREIYEDECDDRDHESGHHYEHCDEEYVDEYLDECVDVDSISEQQYPHQSKPELPPTPPPPMPPANSSPDDRP